MQEVQRGESQMAIANLHKSTTPLACALVPNKSSTLRHRLLGASVHDATMIIVAAT